MKVQNVDQNVDLCIGTKLRSYVRSKIWIHNLVPILGPTYGPKNGPIIRDQILDPGFGVQILVPYRDHRMCGSLRPLKDPNRSMVMFCIRSEFS